MEALNKPFIGAASQLKMPDGETNVGQVITHDHPNRQQRRFERQPQFGRSRNRKNTKNDRGTFGRYRQSKEIMAPGSITIRGKATDYREHTGYNTHIKHFPVRVKEQHARTSVLEKISRASGLPPSPLGEKEEPGDDG